MSEPVAQMPLLPPPDRFGGAGEDGPNPVLMLLRALRGRYAAAALLGLLFAVPFAYLGYSLREPMFKSTGLVRIVPSRDPLIYRTPDNQPLPFFESFVQAQVMFLSSRRVLDQAVLETPLRQAGWPAGAAGVAALQRAVTVVNPPRTEMITVSVTHRDPTLAKLGVNAVLGAYRELQDELTGTRASEQDQLLTSIEDGHTKELRRIRGDITELAKPYGTADLGPIFERKFVQIGEHEAALSSAEGQLHLIDNQGAAPADPAGAAAPVNIDALALTDETLGNITHELTMIEADIATSGHLGPNHPDMINLERRRAALEAQRDARVATLRAGRGAGGGGSALINGSTILSIPELRRHRDREAELLARAQEDLQQIARVRDRIAELRTEEERVQGELDEVRQALKERRTERMNPDIGRVQIAQYGEEPTGPASDRRGLLAAMGGGAGAMLGVGLVALFGLMRNGYRYIDDIETNPLAVPLLGTIPDLHSGDPEHDEMAALSVHHLRNMLQHAGPAGPRAVHAITSGSAGDGKTSLALALGMSFAVSGQRTLLLDADLVGRRLSRLLGLSKRPGLTELIGRDNVNGEVHATSWSNLWMVPAGIASDTGSFSPERLCGEDIDKLFKQLRGRFDRIIVDTGPVLGSLEASLVCPRADRVVLIVSAGQSPKVVEATIRRLNQLGAACAGMVFNRARRDDFDRSVSAAPLSRSIRSVPAPSGAAEVAETSSLVRALEAERRDNGAGRGA